MFFGKLNVVFCILGQIVVHTDICSWFSSIALGECLGSPADNQVSLDKPYYLLINSRGIHILPDAV